LVEKNGIIAEIRTNLQRCKYSDELREEEYFYEDGIGKHTVPLAGFASPVHDSRTSCICVISCDGVGEVTGEYVNRYRGLGAPVVFVCCDGTVQWWSVRIGGAEHERTISKKELGDFFASQEEKLAPERIWRAKNLGRLDKDQQLGFVDIGLMPLLEHEMGERLGGLMKRVITLLQKGFTTEQLKQADSQRWIFQAGFWVLCAKILKDKKVKNFVQLDLNDIDAVVKVVTRHYGARDQLRLETGRQRNALERAANEIAIFGSLSNLTTEAFGYMYENVLVDKKLRDALGIHATPSYLVDYIVWQLWPWVKEIPQDKRVVLEPACGHAPFLTAAMRLLRFLWTGREEDFHRYAKSRMVGIEVDSFAQEMARLSLTMADVPNPNGWQLDVSDVYSGDVLSEAARRSTILLCNPPFQDFRAEERGRYMRIGASLVYRNKAAEVLAKTLPYMPAGSVVGVILPRGFLNRGDVTPLRKMLVEDFEIGEVCTLPDNVFASADHESAVILGRKRTRKVIVGSTKYVRVRERTLDRFRQCYSAPTEVIRQDRFAISQNYVFAIPELEQVWTWCRRLDQLRTVVDEKETGKGLEYKAKEKLPPNAQTVSRRRFPGSVRGYAYFDRDLKLTECPSLWWMSISSDVIRRAGHGMKVAPQILLNSAPVRRGPWRLNASIDRKGYPLSSNFIAVRPKAADWSLDVLWAILNCPLVNAYAYCHGTKRVVGVERILELPIPAASSTDLKGLEELVRKYFGLFSSGGKVMPAEVDSTAGMRGMLRIDAEVMRLYDLPPRLERQLLDLFEGWKRPGVDFEFRGYFPPEFESAIPLHEYLSEEYQRSTVSFVSNWVKKVRSPEIIRALKAAEEAFTED
jgi:hypothetical protein